MTIENLKCSSCNSKIDGDTIKFICGHVYHERCIGENEITCPILSCQNLRLIKNNKQNFSNHILNVEIFTYSLYRQI